MRIVFKVFWNPYTLWHKKLYKFKSKATNLLSCLYVKKRKKSQQNILISFLCRILLRLIIQRFLQVLLIVKFQFCVHWSPDVDMCTGKKAYRYISTQYQNKRPMDHISHLKNQFKSKITNDYIITLITRKKNQLSPFWELNGFYL